MRLSKLNAIILVLNICLMVAGGWYLHTHRQKDPAESSHTSSQLFPTKPSLKLANRGPGAQTIHVTNDFRWAQLESEDYKAYIQRLRDIGCPEQTIRDIIISDLDNVMAPKIESIYGRREKLNYWHPEEEELANNQDHREWSEQERAIDKEKREIIEQLVGVDLVRERLKQRGQTDYYERRLSFLSEDKKGSVRRLLEKYDELEQKIRSKEWEEGEMLSGSDQAELRRLQEERKTELRNVLTPHEQDEYDLWLSPTANSVRHDIYGMEASEEEFLAIYSARKSFDDQWANRDPELLDPAAREKYEQARTEMESSLRRQLGENRYAEYRRGQDEDFHHLNYTVSRFKLPRQTAAEIYEYKRALQDMREKVHAAPGITPEQRQVALAEMAHETEKAVKTLLGDKAYQYYLRRGQGSWIKQGDNLNVATTK